MRTHFESSSRRAVCYAWIAFALMIGAINADEPTAQLLPPESQPVLQKEQPKDKQPDKGKLPKDKEKDKEKKTTTPVLPPDLFTQAENQPNQSPMVFHPHMLGDLPGTFARQTITVNGFVTTTTTTTRQILESGSVAQTTTTTTTTKTPFTQTRTVLVPVGGLGSFKIAENESPIPRDRCFFTWNYFGNIQDPINGAIPAANTTVNSQQTGQRSIGPGTDLVVTNRTSATTSLPGTSRFVGNLNREVFGCERTFLDGYGSFEIRAPLFQQQSNFGAFNAAAVGDITVIGKYAFFRDVAAGNVFSGGLAITCPNGPSVNTVDGTLHSTLIQPWVGYVYNFDYFFMQAFHSVVAPTDPRDTSLMFNDVSLNFWLYRGAPGSFLRFLVPLAEVHVTTPLNHRGTDSAIYIPDLVVMTGGLHVGLARGTVLTLGVASPVSGPNLFQTEAFVQLNWFY